MTKDSTAQPTKVAKHQYAKAKAAYKTTDSLIQKGAKELVEENLGLVRHIVSRMLPYFQSEADREDFHSIGVKGLILAANQFDAQKGKSFANYASIRIRGEILDELRRMDSFSRKNRAHAKELQKATDDLQAKFKRPPTEEEIQKELKLDNKQYNKLIKATEPISFIPIDSPGSSDEEGSTLAEIISDPTEQNAGDIAEKRDLLALVRGKIKTLPDQEKKILVLYYYEGLRLSEIAEVFGLTESRISQILSIIILNLKAHFSKKKN